MPRRPFVAGNWKLNHGPAAARDVAAALGPALAQRGQVDVAVFPPALSLFGVVEALAGTGIAVGVQDVEVAAKGAYTGANSAVMARELGCTHALCGHSERRQLYGDDDTRIGARVRAALDAGLLPLLCVGETLAERRAGQVDAVVTRQLAAGLSDLPPDRVATVTLAYEPVWAIGTGETATPDQAQAVHAAIRAWLAGRYPAWVAETIRVLYGGSVTPANARSLLACPDIDGALVGGASLTVEGLAAIVAAA